MGIHQANNTIDLDRLGGSDLSCGGAGHFEVQVCKGERESRHSPAGQRSGGSQEPGGRQERCSREAVCRGWS